MDFQSLTARFFGAERAAERRRVSEAPLLTGPSLPLAMLS